MLISLSLIDCINRQNDAHNLLCAISLDIAQLENDIAFTKQSITDQELRIVAGLVGPDNDWKSLGSNDSARKHAIDQAQSKDTILKTHVAALYKAQSDLSIAKAEFDNAKRLHAAMGIQQSTLTTLLNALGNIDIPEFDAIDDADSPTETDFASLGI